MSRFPGFRLWLLAFAGFCLLHASWAFSTPYNGPPDEQPHTIRAAGVVDGQIVPPLVPPELADRSVGGLFSPVQDQKQEGGGYQTVPKSLVRPRCFPQHADIAANCAPEPGGDETPVRVSTEAARYNPVYYLATGWPLAISPNWTGIILSRLLNGAAMAALLAGAVVAAARWTRYRAMVAGIVVASTPMIAHLGGAINPNGIEIAAGVSLFAALIALVHEQRDGINKAAVVLAGISAVAIVTPRFTGVLWLAVILGAVLIPSSRARLKELARSRIVRIWLAVAGVATLGAVAWLGIGKQVSPATYDRGFSRSEILRATIIDHVWPNVANQMVGVMGWAETLMPRLIYIPWFMAVGILVLGGLIVGIRVDRWRLLALFVATFAPLLLLEIATADQVGLFNQGRYFLTGAVGLPMLGAWIMARRAFSAEQMRTITRFLTVALLPIHVICVAFTMARWDSGLRSLNPYNGSWHPPLGVTFPLVLVTVAVAVLFVTYWQASRLPKPPADTEPDPAEAESQPVPA